MNISHFEWYVTYTEGCRKHADVLTWRAAYNTYSDILIQT